MVGTGTSDYRVTDDEVSSIITVRPSDNVWPFIRMANRLTDACADNDSGSLLDVELLYQIELNLACHFYSMWRQLYTEKQTGDASGKFQGMTGMYLEASQYGQTAMMMDITGCLAERNRKLKNPPKRPSTFWAGTELDSPRPDGLGFSDI